MSFCNTEKKHIGATLHRASHEIHRALDSWIAATADPELAQMNGMRGVVMGYIVYMSVHGKDVYQRDVEATFHIRRSSVTALLQAMEQAGFIERQSVASDARLKKLVPTQKGFACQQKIDARIDAFEKQLQTDISPGELAAFEKTLQHLCENVCSAPNMSGLCDMPDTKRETNLDKKEKK